MPDDRLLTTKEAARLLGMDEGTLANWRHKRKGPPYIKKDERWVRYWESEIVAWANKDRIVPEGKGEVR